MGFGVAEGGEEWQVGWRVAAPRVAWTLIRPKFSFMPTSADSPRNCKNCDEHLAGGYCFRCGQSDTDFDVPIGAFAKELVSESLDLDSRLRLTLMPLFVRPGLVAKEYVAGHRARFVPPFRLYILASFAMFLVISFTAEPFQLQWSESGEPGVVLEALGRAVDGATGAVGDSASVRIAETESLSERLSDGVSRIGEDLDRFSQDFFNHMGTALFFLLPFFALLLKLLYWRRLYVHHLVFSIYLHSFVFLLFTFSALVGTLPIPFPGDGAGLVMLWIWIYLVLGLRRFYQEFWLKSLLKSGVLLLAYGIALSLTMLSLVFIAVLRA